MTYRLGVDVGGTFTDLLLVDEESGRTWTAKVPSTPADQSVGVPSQVSDLVTRLRQALPEMPLRCHFHNTRNTGIANAYAAVEAGVSVLDASVGGIGGCPFAPAATGNIPTEDLLYMLARMGVATGVDLEQTIATGRWLQDQLGRSVPGMLVKAGAFPPSPAAAA